MPIGYDMQDFPCKICHLKEFADELYDDYTKHQLQTKDKDMPYVNIQYKTEFSELEPSKLMQHIKQGDRNALLELLLQSRFCDEDFDWDCDKIGYSTETILKAKESDSDDDVYASSVSYDSDTASNQQTVSPDEHELADLCLKFLNDKYPLFDYIVGVHYFMLANQAKQLKNEEECAILVSQAIHHLQIALNNSIRLSDTTSGLTVNAACMLAKLYSRHRHEKNNDKLAALANLVTAMKYAKKNLAIFDEWKFAHKEHIGLLIYVIALLDTKEDSFTCKKSQIFRQFFQGKHDLYKLYDDACRSRDKVNALDDLYSQLAKLTEYAATIPLFWQFMAHCYKNNIISEEIYYSILRFLIRSDNINGSTTDKAKHELFIYHLNQHDLPKAINYLHSISASFHKYSPDDILQFSTQQLPERDEVIYHLFTKAARDGFYTLAFKCLNAINNKEWYDVNVITFIENLINDKNNNDNPTQSYTASLKNLLDKIKTSKRNINEKLKDYVATQGDNLLELMKIHTKLKSTYAACMDEFKKRVNERDRLLRKGGVVALKYRLGNLLYADGEKRANFNKEFSALEKDDVITMSKPLPTIKYEAFVNKVKSKLDRVDEFPGERMHSAFQFASNKMKKVAHALKVAARKKANHDKLREKQNMVDMLNKSEDKLKTEVALDQPIPSAPPTQSRAALYPVIEGIEEGDKISPAHLEGHDLQVAAPVSVEQPKEAKIEKTTQAPPMTVTATPVIPNVGSQGFLAPTKNTQENKPSIKQNNTKRREAVPA